PFGVFSYLNLEGMAMKLVSVAVALVALAVTQDDGILQLGKLEKGQKGQITTKSAKSLGVSVSLPKNGKEKPKDTLLFKISVIQSENLMLATWGPTGKQFKVFFEVKTTGMVEGNNYTPEGTWEVVGTQKDGKTSYYVLRPVK